MSRGTDVLLGGSRSPSYLGAALDALSTILPRSRRIHIPGADHLAAKNDGKPELVARQLSRFFGAPQF